VFSARHDSTTVHDLQQRRWPSWKAPREVLF
jgi:hypothetical protein